MKSNTPDIGFDTWTKIIYSQKKGKKKEMNHRNPAIKRILADVKELERHPSSSYHAAPLEENMFEWHFTIRGPSETSFAEGIYHGRIIFPADYPLKAPDIVFLTVKIGFILFP
jgi:ubiquitin-protein ligase